MMNNCKAPQIRGVANGSHGEDPGGWPKSAPPTKKQRLTPAQVCDICGRFARVPFDFCCYCGARPSWHHGRCCPAKPVNQPTSSTASSYTSR